jgi:putative phage-type endonuclease
MSTQLAVIEAPQNTEKWLRERRKYMGSSDAPAAFGMSRYRNPIDVAQDKRQARVSDEPPEPDTPQQHRGHVLEAVVAALYEERTGKTLCVAKSVVHPEHDWMAASPDRWVAGENVIVEIKTHNVWTKDQYGVPGTDEVPDYEFVQVQHQMAVTGAEQVNIAVLFGEPQALQILAEMVDGGVSLELAARLAGQMEFRTFSVVRDDGFIGDLIAAEEEFWNRYVLGDEWPENIHAMEPRSGVRNATSQEELQAAKLREAWIEKERGDSRYESLKEWFKDAIADAEGIDTGEGVITWKKNKNTVVEVTDWEAAAKEIQEMLAREREDAPTLAMFRDLHTKPVVKTGARVFRVPAGWKKDL